MKILLIVTLLFAACGDYSNYSTVTSAVLEERSVKVGIATDESKLPNDWFSAPWTSPGPDAQGCVNSYFINSHHAYCLSDYNYDPNRSMGARFDNSTWFGCSDYRNCPAPVGLEENWRAASIQNAMPEVEWNAITGVTRIDIEADIRHYPAGEIYCLRPKFPAVGWSSQDKCSCLDSPCSGSAGTVIWSNFYLNSQPKSLFITAAIGLKLGGPMPGQNTPGPVASLGLWLHQLQIGAVRVKVYYQVPVGTPGHPPQP